MEIVEPKRVMPKTDIDEPRRPNLRRDNELPNETKSNNERELPKRTVPYTESVAPKRANLLRDIELPKFT